MNGLGDRAGGCPLEELVMAIKVRGESRGLSTSVNTTQLAKVSKLVSRLTLYPVPANKPVVGANAFVHGVGIHQHGVMVDPTTYEVMDPQDVGAERSQILLTKHSGRHAFARALSDLGIDLKWDQLEAAFERFKEYADEKAFFTDAELTALVAGEEVENPFYVLVSAHVAGGTLLKPAATVRLRSPGGAVEGSSVGDNLLAAMFGAVDRATNLSPVLERLRTVPASDGVDRLSDISVVLSLDDTRRGYRRAAGRGVGTDIVDAAIRAYLEALNRLLVTDRQGDS
jgi:2-isopropylmalate synthase